MKICVRGCVWNTKLHLQLNINLINLRIFFQFYQPWHKFFVVCWKNLIVFHLHNVDSGNLHFAQNNRVLHFRVQIFNIYCNFHLVIFSIFVFSILFVFVSWFQILFVLVVISVLKTDSKVKSKIYCLLNENFMQKLELLQMKKRKDLYFPTQNKNLLSSVLFKKLMNLILLQTKIS